MDIQILTRFFMWCTILNFVLLCLSFLICAFGADWAYRLHGKWFPMQRETFNVVLYSFIGLYKLMFYFFIVIPYVALLIVG
ncbi:DUF6868 family protein [Verrucomicrobiota bacterium]